MATAAAAPCWPSLPLNLSSSSSSCSSSPSSPSLSKPHSTLLNFSLKIPNPNLTLKKTLPLKFPRFSISAAAGGGNQKKEQKLTSEGLVTEALPNCMFRVKLENGDEILGYLSGKMQKNKIFIVPGDRVEIEVGKYDATRGRITFRRDTRVRRPPGGGGGGGKDPKSSR